jgi:hypothetical protein
MRRIIKQQVPECLAEFINGQLLIEPEPVNLTYGAFRDKKALQAILTAEQFGICGYTGSPIDDQRISNLKAEKGDGAFSNHIEHLKSQKLCREELRAAGKVFGRDFAQDLDYNNLIAALEVRGAETEQFGAVAKADQLPPVLPVEPGCDQRFEFREDGVVEGRDGPAADFVELLLLNHDTLKGWRKQAIDAWLDPQVIQSAEDFKEVLVAVTTPKDGLLPEFAFAIEGVARSYLDEANV